MDPSTDTFPKSLYVNELIYFTKMNALQIKCVIYDDNCYNTCSICGSVMHAIKSFVDNIHYIDVYIDKICTDPTVKALLKKIEYKYPTGI